MKASIAVPEDGALFAGHFPGRPILPGVAELALVAQALAPSTGASAVCAIPHARFRGLVLPGDILEVEAAPRGEGSVRFDVRRAGALVANGAMTFGAPRADEDRASAVAAAAPRIASPVAGLIPHRPPMLFVEKVLGEAEDGLTCLGRVSRSCALVEQGIAPAFVALELAAQTAAVWAALRRPGAERAAEPRVGYLVSLGDVALHRATIPADADLIASIRLTASTPPLATYEVDVAAEGERVLRGTIGTYLSD